MIQACLDRVRAYQPTEAYKKAFLYTVTSKAAWVQGFSWILFLSCNHQGPIHHLFDCLQTLHTPVGQRALDTSLFSA
jgi:hypothetical protein